ncbi:hypothetical protein Hanom_Chr09g00849661 [Helianthus anomalus]
MLPCSTYQNSVSLKLFNISCNKQKKGNFVNNHKFKKNYILMRGKGCFGLTKRSTPSFFNAGRLIKISDLRRLDITYMVFPFCKLCDIGINSTM